MAQQITKYRAVDGSEWNALADAEKRDAIVAQVNAVMAQLKPVPDTCDFANGEGYVQQSGEAVRKVKADLYELVAPYLSHWINSQKDTHGKSDDDMRYKVHPSWFGRMLDGGCDPLEHAYSRLCRIDTENREWGQGYYAANPEKAPDQNEIGANSSG